MRRSLSRPASSLIQCLKPCVRHRTLISGAARRWPQASTERQAEFPNDPEAVLRVAHEKERQAFRNAIQDRDFLVAYRIYVEQQGLPILSGSEITSLIQLISADANLRRLNGDEHPKSLQDVLWTVVEDVKEGRSAGQAVMWMHAFNALIIWDQYAEAQELWTYVHALPKRVSVDKNDALCIDSRVYGSIINLYTDLGEFAKADEIYREVVEDDQLKSSIILEQAMIRALFSSRRVGEAYKLMDKVIWEQRRAIQPTFFSSLVGYAIEAEALGVATEIFMKSCKVKLLPAPSIVTRLLDCLSRSGTNQVESVMAITKHYQHVTGRPIPVEHTNCVLSTIFSATRAGLSKEDAMAQIQQVLEDLNKSGARSSSVTFTTLLSGYMALGEHQLVDKLMSSGELTENTFRTIFKTLAHNNVPDASAQVHNIWTRFEHFRQADGTHFLPRDLQMVMRAAYATNFMDATRWIPELFRIYAPEPGTRARRDLDVEHANHRKGRFKVKVVDRSRYSKPTVPA